MNCVRKYILKFIHFIFSESNKGFGIHSPFAFDFIVNVLNEKSFYYAYERIDNIADNKCDKKYLKFLYRLVNYYQKTNLAIIGHSDKAEQLSKLLCSSYNNIDKYSNLSDVRELDRYDFVYLADDNPVNCGRKFKTETIIVVEKAYLYKSQCYETKIDEKYNLVVDFFDFTIIFVKNNFNHHIYKLKF